RLTDIFELNSSIPDIDNIGFIRSTE
ncbi:unnamed protein product, partial [Rotaria sordida]